jgi:hypothetical protein
LVLPAVVNPRETYDNEQAMPRFEIGFLDDHTEESLLNEVRRVAERYSGSNLTLVEFAKLSPKVSGRTLRRRFGTWGNVLERSGLAHLYAAPNRYTDEQCFENLATVWTHLGRCPEYRELRKPPSVISPETYADRWGTWRKSLKIFVEWANSEGPTTPSKTTSDSVVVRIASREETCRDVRPGLRFRVFMRGRFRCLACGRSPATHLNIELHADHILAVANGGKTTLENLQTLCRECNLGKGRTILS